MNPITISKSKANKELQEYVQYLLGKLFTEFLYSKEVERFIDQHINKYKESVYDIENFLKLVFKGEAKSSSEEINNLVNDYRQLLYAEAICFYVECLNIKGGKYLTTEDVKLINKITKEELDKF